jgi:hypothetical protein
VKILNSVGLCHKSDVFLFYIPIHLFYICNILSQYYSTRKKNEFLSFFFFFHIFYLSICVVKNKTNDFFFFFFFFLDLNIYFLCLLGFCSNDNTSSFFSLKYIYIYAYTFASISLSFLFSFLFFFARILGTLRYSFL